MAKIFSGPSSPRVARLPAAAVTSAHSSGDEGFDDAIDFEAEREERDREEREKRREMIKKQVEEIKKEPSSRRVARLPAAAAAAAAGAVVAASAALDSKEQELVRQQEELEPQEPEQPEQLQPEPAQSAGAVSSGDEGFDDAINFFDVLADLAAAGMEAEDVQRKRSENSVQEQHEHGSPVVSARSVQGGAWGSEVEPAVERGLEHLVKMVGYQEPAVEAMPADIAPACLPTAGDHQRGPFVILHCHFRSL